MPALLALLLPLLLASSSPVQSIESIEIRGLKALSEDTLLHYLGLAPGQPLDEGALNRKIKELWNRNLVDGVEVESTSTPAGVRLLITVSERPVLRSIDYEGLKRITKTDLQDKMSSQRIRVREGEPLSLGELQRIKTLIEEMYGEKGYRFATAQYSVEDVGPNEKKVVFAVDEGSRVRISDIDFEGNAVYNDLRLRLTMKKTKESGLITRITKKDVYDPAKLQEDLDKLRDLYQASGYKNVVIGDPKVEVRALKPGAARRMSITVPIEEGERWKFGQVTIEGNQIHSDQLLMRVFTHETSGWLRSKVIDDAVKKIESAYHDTGYIFARVEPELVEREDHLADLVVHVQEGEQFKVGRIEFEGNDSTNDKVLRRELRLYEGGLMSLTALRNSVLKVNQLGYFKLNDEDPVEIDTDTEKKEVNLLLKGDEADRTEVQLTGGWSEVDGPFGQFGVNTKNFLGRGEHLGASFQSGDRSDSLDLSYTMPWFLDRPQSIGFRAFDQAYEYGDIEDLDYYARDSQGAVLTYGRNFRLFQSASLSYNLSRYDDRYNVLLADDTITTIQGFINNSSLRPMYVFDSRDNPFDASRGKRLSLAVEYAGGFLGGDNYFIRPEASFSIFQPVSDYPTRSVLAFNAKGGLINSFDGYGIPTLERYFLGGESSIRGHEPRSIYLRDSEGNPRRDKNGAVLGGDRFVQLNLEYHFLLGGPFRLLLFTDAANVFGEGQTFDLSNLRTTAGVELRVLLPMFGAPLRFIYAKNLDPRPQDDFEDFKFSIGTSF
ncbi:MAG TPA: outer membrane protein assembly factor BamA [Thermoanaerobaculia bacterium]|nr:outer membrane protein assembly factor BamA [Thermoanaerobaculia bacterium]